jgi:hypothetical protein
MNLRTCAGFPRISSSSWRREIRERIISTASVNGGHLAPHLGVVELTLAVHYVFNTPEDLLVWDVGHQTYAHKLDYRPAGPAFPTIRKKGGLSGYPRAVAKVPTTPSAWATVRRRSRPRWAWPKSSRPPEGRERKRRRRDRRRRHDRPAWLSRRWPMHAGHLGRDLVVDPERQQACRSRPTWALSRPTSTASSPTACTTAPRATWKA